MKKAIDKKIFSAKEISDKTGMLAAAYTRRFPEEEETVAEFSYFLVCMLLGEELMNQTMNELIKEELDRATPEQALFAALAAGTRKETEE